MEDKEIARYLFGHSYPFHITTKKAAMLSHCPDGSVVHSHFCLNKNLKYTSGTILMHGARASKLPTGVQVQIHIEFTKHSKSSKQSRVSHISVSCLPIAVLHSASRSFTCSIISP